MEEELDKIIVKNGKIVLDGVELRLFCRKRKVGESYFLDDFDNVVILDDSILSFEKAKIVL